MRAKLTAKHPRPATPERAPVRRGSTTARKPARPAETRPAEGRPARPFAATPAGKPASGKPANARERDTSGRPARAPREGGGYGDERGERGFARGRREGDERRPFRARDEGGERRFPRRDENDSQRPFRAREEGGERRFPRRDEGEGQRPVRARDEGGERRPFRAREEGGERRFPRRDEGEGQRPFRARDEGGERRPFRARDEGGERRPFRARDEGGERRFPRRDENDSQRPFRARDEGTDRPAFRRDQRSDERRPRDDRGFARPVKPSWDNSNERSGAGSRPRGRNEGESFAPRERRNAEDARARKPGPKPFAKSADQAPRREPGRAAGEHAAPQRAARVEVDGDNVLRLSKRMSELGLCSRREADEWIEKGWVYVDGEVVDTLGAKVTPTQRIEVDPAALAAQARQVTILLHKPVGYVSGQAEDGYEPAATLVTAENHWDGDRSGIRFSAQHLRTLAPAGRLDIDSTGLLVLTQDGRVAKQLIGESSDIDKEYLVRVTYDDIETEIDQHFPPELLAKLRHGLSLDDVPLKPAMVSWQNGEQLRFVLREGKKRQIRRMCELVGLKVVGLKRVRMGRVLLGALPQGQWRYLSADEAF
ncbi:MAG: pseudouridine synthase [Paraburkholderia sp.]|jgi:23S rRNA pseudouridine2604 synthase|nr:pseudouridine synthase [Paraburkholderia sp.]